MVVEKNEILKNIEFEVIKVSLQTIKIWKNAEIKLLINNKNNIKLKRIIFNVKLYDENENLVDIGTVNAYDVQPHSECILEETLPDIEVFSFYKVELYDISCDDVYGKHLEKTMKRLETVNNHEYKRDIKYKKNYQNGNFFKIDLVNINNKE